MQFNAVQVDPDLVDLIPDFLANTQVDYEKFKKFLDQEDFLEMDRICHRILGTAESYGFTQLDEIVKELQHLVKLKDSAQLKVQFELLSRYIDFVQDQFNYFA